MSTGIVGLNPWILYGFKVLAIIFWFLSLGVFYLSFIGGSDSTMFFVGGGIAILGVITWLLSDRLA